MTAPKQAAFDLTIGQLDRVLSLLVLWGKGKDELDEPNRQTLKHHAEDMIAAGEKILKCLGEQQDGLPQPEGPQPLLEDAPAEPTQADREADEFIDYHVDNVVRAEPLLLAHDGEEPLRTDGNRREFTGFVKHGQVRPGTLVLRADNIELRDDGQAAIVRRKAASADGDLTANCGQVWYGSGKVTFALPVAPGPGQTFLCDYEFNTFGVGENDGAMDGEAAQAG